jgi:hypothetical protein
LDAERYVILDGANRHYALQQLGYPHILVQVVSYESGAVELETWHHVISGISWFEFLRNLREIRTFQIESSDLLSARAALARRDVLAYTVLSDNRAYTLNAEVHTLAARTAVLREMVNTYKARGTLNRINTDSISIARRLYPEAVAIVVFPRYHPAEIMVAARDGVHLPPGISRHIIRGRAMRLNYPLSALAETARRSLRKTRRCGAGFNSAWQSGASATTLNRLTYSMSDKRAWRFISQSLIKCRSRAKKCALSG